MDHRKWFYEFRKLFAQDSRLTSINLTFFPPEQILNKIESGEIDCVPYIQGFVLDAHDVSSDISIIFGQETSHLTLNLNNLDGRFFSDPRIRRGLQYLVWNKIKSNSLALNTPYLALDPQIYMATQPGRLSNLEIDDLISTQRSDLDFFMRSIDNVKLAVLSNEASRPLFNALKSIGLPFSENSRVLDQKSFVNYYYKTFETDILIAAFSIVNGDPDGIYHRLGSNGAILSPMSYSPSVGQMLESGRMINKIHDLDAHYKEVSRKVLTDVPFIHIGFVKNVALIRNKILTFNRSTLQRREGHLNAFELRQQ